jgi:predicted acyl esterase
MPDTDVTVKLLDAPGRSMNMVEGITRARYRDSFAKPTMMEKAYEVPVDLHATSW